MAIDLYRIDKIEDYDQAIDALEDFVIELVEEFAESPEGKAYLAAHPEMQDYLGSWIDNLLYFAYNYESVTLPRMTKEDVDLVVTQLFPRKVSLMNPDEADSTIPELIAFWEYLKRQYKHRQATKIITFLKKIQPKFKGLMNDPQNFGMAKSFMMQGLSEGFDMTSQEGLEAFQQQYNQQLQESKSQNNNNQNEPGLINLSGVNSLESLLQRLGNTAGNPNLAPGEIAPPPELLQLLNSLADVMEIEGLTLEDIDREDDEDEEEEGEFSLDFQQVYNQNLWQKVADEIAPLTEQEEELLKQQKISETSPGTILQDFQNLLNYIGDSDVAVSNTNHLFPLKLLRELNRQLAQPTVLDLKRPVQKSFPTLNGLYLLLRTTGLCKVFTKGKKHFLSINSSVLQSWNALNITEKYCTLLEAWLIHATEESFGEKQTFVTEGLKCFRFWPRIPDKGQRYPKQEAQQDLQYIPDPHNVALLQLFGFLEVETGKPEAGKGWRVKKVKRLPFGDAMMKQILHTFVEKHLTRDPQVDTSFGLLQPDLQPYFPEWEKNLVLEHHQFQSGVYTFKVSVQGVWRRIGISAQETLYDLSRLILDSVDFDDDHLDMFMYRNQMGHIMQVHHPIGESEPKTTEVRIGDLPLEEGSELTYVFDFGDWWEFNIVIETIDTQDPRSEFAEILESSGDSPQQYPDWDWEEEE